ncbi:Atg2 protein [Maudiozyma humilis]|uniref:Autophagy-related protein 2 n=1 Tax=Maudiozyma humilis TaxID=51915 RepID=A0AAV5S9H0_MAUHU|nr:Atg2 protein [Kazachstania humilis]
MAFGWSQNIQRRLLLYVLQQISLFSNLDLSNINVSLGTSSSFNFQDIDLDVSDIDIPYITVESGGVAQLHLDLTVSGGLDITGDGLTFDVILREITDNGIESSVFSSSVPNFLAKSMHDLTTSVINFSNDEHLRIPIDEISSESDTDESNSEDDVSNKPDNNNIDKNSEQKSKPTKLQSMRNTVLSTILSKLTLDLSNISVNYLDKSNSCAYTIHVDHIKLSTTEDRIRHVIVGKITISHEATKEGTQANETSENNIPEDNTESSFFSKATASSVYMSAHEFQTSSNYTPSSTMPIASQQEETPEVTKIELLSLNDISISFRGLTSVDDINLHDICVDIADIDLYLNHITNYTSSTLRQILQTVYKHANSSTTEERIIPENNLKNLTDIKNSDAYQRFEKKQRVDFDNTLSYIDMKKITIHISDDISLELLKNNINRLVDGSFFCEVSTLNISGRDITISKHPSPFLRIKLSSNIIDIEFPTAINLTFSGDSLVHILHCYNDFNNFWTHTTVRNKTSRHTRSSKVKDKTRHLKLKTEDLSLSLKVSDYKLTILADPICYHSQQSEIEVPGLRLIKHDNITAFEFLTLSSIKFKTHDIPIEVQGMNENFSPNLVTSKLSCRIKSISTKASLPFLRNISRDIQPIIASVRNQIVETENTTNKHVVSLKRSQYMRKSVRILNTSGILYRKSSQASIIVKCETFKFKISEIFPDSNFGTLKGHLGNINIFVLEGSNEVIIDSSSIALERHRTKGDKQHILHAIDINDSVDAKLFACIKKAKTGWHLTCSFKNVNLNYHLSWRKYFKSSNTQENPKSESQLFVENTETIASIDQTGFVVDVKFNDSSVLLLPFRLKAGLLILVDQLTLTYDNGASSSTGVAKTASILLIDDVGNRKVPSATNLDKSRSLLTFYSLQGFSMVGKLNIFKFETKHLSAYLDMAINCDTAEFSLCADSQHTLTQVIIDLKYPETFPDNKKFNAETFEPADIFKNIDMDFLNTRHDMSETKLFHKENGSLNPVESFLDRSDMFKAKPDTMSQITESSQGGSSNANSISFDEDYIDKLRNLTIPRETDEQSEISEGEMDKDEETLLLKLKARIKRADIKLYDGYDWKYSRKTIKTSYSNMSSLDGIKNMPNENTHSNSEEETRLNPGVSVFDSIFISPEMIKNGDSKEVKNERPSDVTTATTQKPSPINLRPSKFYQLLAQLTEMDITFKSYDSAVPTSDQSRKQCGILNNLELLVTKAEIIDNVPTSSWNKFLTEMHRGTANKHNRMIKLSFMMTRPLDYLEAVDYRFDLSVAPLRLHLDQDAVDFLIRFLEFKDPRFALIDEYPEIPFVDRFHLSPIKVSIDYKPKAVDYAKLRSGHTSELMNFVTLEGAHATLKEITLHGLNGFRELSDHLKNKWTPDILQHQLGGVIGGISPIKSFFTLGSEVKTFVTVLLSDYRSGNEMSSSLKNNGNIFLKTATGDFIKLGVKMSSGTQAVLEAAEQRLGGQGINGRLEQDVNYEKIVAEDQLVGGTNPRVHDHEPAAIIIEENDGNDTPPRVVSLYADQPLDVHAGLEEAYRSLEKHMNIAYDAVWKAHDEWEGDPMQGPRAAAVAVMKTAPIAIIRPLIGVTEAVSKTFQGLTNQIDKRNITEMQDKYKSGPRRQ